MQSATDALLTMHASISDPLKVVQELFEQAGCPVAAGNVDWGVQALFDALLSDPSVRAQVWHRKLARS